MIVADIDFTEMSTFSAVKYSRLSGTEEHEFTNTCSITPNNYGTSGSRDQIINGHLNPLDVEKTVSTIMRFNICAQNLKVELNQMCICHVIKFDFTKWRCRRQADPRSPFLLTI